MLRDTAGQRWEKPGRTHKPSSREATTEEQKAERTLYYKFHLKGELPGLRAGFKRKKKNKEEEEEGKKKKKTRWT